jgi:hypothetical protein
MCTPIILPRFTRESNICLFDIFTRLLLIWNRDTEFGRYSKDKKVELTYKINNINVKWCNLIAYNPVEWNLVVVTLGAKIKSLILILKENHCRHEKWTLKNTYFAFPLPCFQRRKKDKSGQLDDFYVNLCAFVCVWMGNDYTEGNSEKWSMVLSLIKCYI